ncbi:MAG: PAS domain-containing protein, partial [Aliidongia sp.]
MSAKRPWWIGLGAAMIAVAPLAVSALGYSDHVIFVVESAEMTIAIFAALLTVLMRRRDVTRDALDASPVLYIIADSAGRIAYANPTARAFLPTEPFAALRGMLVPDGISDFEAMVVKAGAARAMLAANVEDRPRWLDIATMPLDRGRVLWRIEDVSEAETARRRQAAEWESLVAFFEQVPVGLYSLDETGRFIAVNQVFAQWLGVSAIELIGTRFQSVIWSDPVPRQVEFDPLAPAEGVELRLRGGGGVPVDILLEQRIQFRATGPRTLSVVRNMALEHSAGLSRSSRERFQRFFELAPVGIALIDAKARFQDTNRALDELLTESREHVLGQGLLEYIADDALGEVRARLAAISVGEQAARPIETRLKGAGGKTVARFVSRLEAADRTLAGLILHFIDLTEQKKLEVQFAQSQKMQAVGQLAGGVAHDFNNLLTAMIGFCDLLLLRFRPGDQSFADIMQIKQNANRAANLVRQLLAFSRQQTLQPRIIQIGEVLAELSHLLNRLLGDNVELKMLHGRQLGPVRVDQGQLEQVIINLAVNARDAMPKGGTLTIRTS